MHSKFYPISSWTEENSGVQIPCVLETAESVTAMLTSAYCKTDGRFVDDDMVKKNTEQNLAPALNYGLTSFP